MEKWKIFIGMEMLAVVVLSCMNIVKYTGEVKEYSSYTTQSESASSHEPTVDIQTSNDTEPTVTTTEELQATDTQQETILEEQKETETVNQETSERIVQEVKAETHYDYEYREWTDLEKPWDNLPSGEPENRLSLDGGDEVNEYDVQLFENPNGELKNISMGLMDWENIGVFVENTCVLKEERVAIYADFYTIVYENEWFGIMYQWNDGEEEKASIYRWNGKEFEKLVEQEKSYVTIINDEPNNKKRFYFVYMEQTTSHEQWPGDFEKYRNPQEPLSVYKHVYTEYEWNNGAMQEISINTYYNISGTAS